MNETAVLVQMQDQRIAETMRRERDRLWQFIRKRVPDLRDAEDILQDVFCELTAAYRLLTPIEQAGAWLFQVARNRIADSFRKMRPEGLADGEGESLEDLLPSPDAGPEAVYARTVLTAVIADALKELPEEQRAVFMAHELDGKQFKELAAETGVPVNTLLSRKRYAVLFLRQRLQAVYADFKETR